MAQWVSIPLQNPVIQNVDETALRTNLATLENGYYNDEGGHTRFPGLAPFVDVAGDQRVDLYKYRGDMVAVSGGRFYRIDRDGNVHDETGVVISGGQRTVFSKTEFELLMAAGGKVVRYRGKKTEILSDSAPETTHVAYISGYVIVLEKRSQRWYHSEVGDYETFDPIDVFSAEGKPDGAVALIVSAYEELMVAGEDSLEQFEPLASGDQPFFRRWMAGRGVSAPYSLVATDDGVWGISEDAEFVRFVSQSTEDISDPIQATLDEADDLSDAWSSEIIAFGQKWIVVQLPNATNVYGTAGITLLYDVRHRRWSTLYGWDEGLVRPVRWPGWGHLYIWGKHFVGGNGKIYQLSNRTYDNDGVVQRMLGRTGHYDQSGVQLRCNNFRIRMKRGQENPNAEAGTLRVRVRRDNTQWSPWVSKSLGASGQQHMTIDFGPMGSGDTFQWEYEITSAVPVEIAKIQAQIERV